MPYTIAWNNSTPALSELANQTAPYFQNTKFAISERMTGLFVTDWTADPLVVLPQILGNVAAKQLLIHPAEINWNGDTRMQYHDENSGDYLVFTQSVLGPHNVWGFLNVDIPVGCTINTVTCWLRGDGSNISTLSLYKQVLGTALTTPPTQVFSVGYSGNTLTGLSDSPGETVVVGTSYVIILNLVSNQGSNVAVQGLQITYSTPDCRSTR